MTREAGGGSTSVRKLRAIEYPPTSGNRNALEVVLDLCSSTASCRPHLGGEQGVLRIEGGVISFNQVVKVAPIVN